MEDGLQDHCYMPLHMGDGLIYQSEYIKVVETKQVELWQRVKYIKLLWPAKCHTFLLLGFFFFFFLTFKESVFVCGF